MPAIILMFVEFWILNLFGSPSSYHHQNLKSNPEQCHWLPPSVLAGQKWSGLINHWFPLIRPAGVALERVPLDWLLPNLTPCNGRFQGPSSGGAPSARHGAVVLVGGYVMSWSLGGVGWFEWTSWGFFIFKDIFEIRDRFNFGSFRCRNLIKYIVELFRSSYLIERIWYLPFSLVTASSGTQS